jgi:hypothetical protein
MKLLSKKKKKKKKKKLPLALTRSQNNFTRHASAVGILKEGPVSVNHWQLRNLDVAMRQ